MSNKKFSDEVLELQNEFNFGVKLKQKYYRADDFDFLRKPAILFGEILVALGAKNSFEILVTKLANSCGKPKVIYGASALVPHAIANKIAEKILSIPIEQRLEFLKWAKQECDAANDKVEELKRKLDNKKSDGDSNTAA